MISAIRKLFAQNPSQRLAVRSFDGGAGGRRWQGGGEMANQSAAVLGARATIARRARYLTGNNPLARAGVDSWTSAIAGTGIKGQSGHSDPGVRALINSAFEAWTDSADADGLTDFYGLQALAVSRMVVDGEALAIMRTDDRGNLGLRLLDPEQLDGSLSRDFPGGGKIVAGVEFDAAGRRIAYHIFKDRPALSASLSSVRVTAENVIHMFRPEAPGQVRGLSWFAPVLLRLHEHDQAIDAQLVRQKIGAMLTGFIVDAEGQAAGFSSGDQSNATGGLEGGLEPGALKVLAPGQDVRFSDPAAIGPEAIAFMQLTAREIAVGLGVPYESLTGDLSTVNYSSIRAGLVEFRRRAEIIQHGTVAFQLLRPIWRKWILTEILSGRMNAPGFDSDPEAYLAVKWIAPKQQWVDPSKDVQAEAAAIAAGLMSRREAVAARGIDIEALDSEISADKARADSLGLDFSAAPQAARNSVDMPQ